MKRLTALAMGLARSATGALAGPIAMKRLHGLISPCFRPEIGQMT
jgi:hypothetical protein